MDYARDTGRPELASVKGLAKASTVSRPTIDEMLSGGRSVGVDKLEAVAHAYDIQAWTLLIPHLDPANPPIKLISKTEQQLYKRLGRVAREYEQMQREQSDKASTPRPPGADRDRTRQGSDGTGRNGGHADD